MINSDLAIRRNIGRFPEDFIFQFTAEALPEIRPLHPVKKNPIGLVPAKD